MLISITKGSNLRTKKGIVKSGDDFLAMIGYGVRGGRQRFFTYVLKDDKLFFCETGQEFFRYGIIEQLLTFGRDFTSKHAMHANCDENVRYAGEFHVQKKSSGRFVVWIDNNSGTYSPNDFDLPVVAGLFEKNFPGLRVRVELLIPYLLGEIP